MNLLAEGDGNFTPGSIYEFDLETRGPTGASVVRAQCRFIEVRKIADTQFLKVQHPSTGVQQLLLRHQVNGARLRS